MSVKAGQAQSSPQTNRACCSPSGTGDSSRVNEVWLKALITLAPRASEATTSLDVRSPKSNSSTVGGSNTLIAFVASTRVLPDQGGSAARVLSTAVHGM